MRDKLSKAQVHEDHEFHRAPVPRSTSRPRLEWFHPGRHCFLFPPGIRTRCRSNAARLRLPQSELRLQLSRSTSRSILLSQPIKATRLRVCGRMFASLERRPIIGDVSQLTFLWRLPSQPVASITKIYWQRLLVSLAAFIKVLTAESSRCCYIFFSKIGPVDPAQLDTAQVWVGRNSMKSPSLIEGISPVAAPRSTARIVRRHRTRESISSMQARISEQENSNDNSS